MSHETFHFLHQTVSSFSPVVSDGTFRKTPSKLDSYASLSCDQNIVKLRQGSGKDRQGMAVKAKGLKALTLA